MQPQTKLILAELDRMREQVLKLDALVEEIDPVKVRALIAARQTERPINAALIYAESVFS